jgi:hypothetical protein
MVLLRMITLNDTHTHSVGILYVSDQPVAEPFNDTQHSQKKDIHVPGGTRTCNLSKQEAADPRLRPRDDQDTNTLICIISYI